MVSCYGSLSRLIQPSIQSLEIVFLLLEEMASLNVGEAGRQLRGQLVPKGASLSVMVKASIDDFYYPAPFQGPPCRDLFHSDSTPTTQEVL